LETHANPWPEAPIMAEQVMKDLRGTSVFPENPPPRVYHYTTPEGLAGILKTQCLHATDVLYMNDASEQAYADSLIQRVISALDKDPLMGFLTETLRLKRQREHVAIYAACFCERGDLLSQWRAYSNGGTGYAIELDWKAMAGPQPGPWPVAGKVEYDAKAQEALVERILGQAFKESLPELKATIEGIRVGSITRDDLWPPAQKPQSPSAGEESVDLLQIALDRIKSTERSSPDFLAGAMQLGFAAAETVGRTKLVSPQVAAGLVRPFLKSSVFSQEEEWRLVGWLPPATIEQFRVKNGILVPYTEFRAPGLTTLPITKIIVGPGLHPQRARDSLLRLLAQSKLGHVPVEASPIPLQV